jgi:hypothetical protein
MFWRPVPGFAPTPAAYAPAVELTALGRDFLGRLQSRGGMRPDVDLDLLFGTWSSVLGGVISQQLSNAPGQPYETGDFTSTVPELIAMWHAHFAPPSAVPSRPEEF